MSWTDERIELLRKLWLDGMSASRIANELANGLTRNAVIGKVYRLGLSGRTKSSGTVEATPKVRVRPVSQTTASPPPAPMVHGNTALAYHPEPIQGVIQEAVQKAMPEEAVPEISKDVVVAFAEPVTIVDLRESMCRWPIGDPGSTEFRFCGAAKRIGAGPYCAHHAGIAYQPQHDRRRMKPIAKPA